MITSVYLAAHGFLPAMFQLEATVGIQQHDTLTPTKAWLCVVMGACGGLIVGLVNEYVS